jgi:hypothetical protein
LHVIGEVVFKNIECRANEANHAVGVTTRPTPVYFAAAFDQPLVGGLGISRRMRQVCEILGQSGKSKRARSTLARTFVRHPTNDTLGFHDAARGLRDDDNHARARGDPVGLEFFVAVTNVEV